MSDTNSDVESLLVRAMNDHSTEEPDGGKKGTVAWLREKLGLSSEEEAPEHVRETFQHIFDMVRRALGARDEDFALGNVSLRRRHRGVHLDYSWRENREESVTCSCGGKRLSLTRDEFMSTTHTLRKSMSMEREGTNISASVDGTNQEISEADCRAALALFEEACRVVGTDEDDAK